MAKPVTESVALAILSKTPGFAEAKTRLAGTIGKARAAQLHGILVQRSIRLAKSLSANTAVKVYMAPAEEFAEAHDWWQSKGLETISTGQGHLGCRMHAVHSVLMRRHSACVLAGTDCPSLDAEQVIAAIRQLEQAPATIGPCHDGGFYLFGSRFSVPLSCWQQPTWGGGQARQQFLASLHQAGHNAVQTLVFRYDLDTIEDAVPVLAQMPADDPDRKAIAECLKQALP